MALLERVSTLLRRQRAVEMILSTKRRNREKTLRQLLLDMERPARPGEDPGRDRDRGPTPLERKKKEHDEAFESWDRKANWPSQGQDDLARAALDRSLSHQQLAEGFSQQIEDQRSEAEIMRTNYGKLQQKLKEPRRAARS